VATKENILMKDKLRPYLIYPVRIAVYIGLFFAVTLVWTAGIKAGDLNKDEALMYLILLTYAYLLHKAFMWLSVRLERKLIKVAS
jgi:hypothetical protein